MTKRIVRDAAGAGVHVHTHIRGAGAADPPAAAERPQSVLDLEDYDDAIAALPEGTIAKLYRLDENGQQGIVTEAPAGGMRESVIARYGPGIYIVKFRGRVNDGTRRVVFKGERRVYVDESAALEARPPLVTPAPAPAPAPAPGSAFPGVQPSTLMDAAVLQFLSMMGQQQREHSTVMMAMLEKMGRRTEDPANPLLMAILPELLKGRNVDPIEQATRIAEIGTKSSARGQLADVTATMELIDRLKERTPEAGVPWYADIVKEGVGVIRDRQAERPPAAVAAPGAGNGAPAAALAGGEPAAALAGPLQMIGGFIPDIARGASSGKDPALVADWIAGDIPPGLYTTVRRILEAPGVAEQVCASYGELAPYVAYVEDVRVALVAALADDDAAGE